MNSKEIEVKHDRFVYLITAKKDLEKLSKKLKIFINVMLIFFILAVICSFSKKVNDLIKDLYVPYVLFTLGYYATRKSETVNHIVSIENEIFEICSQLYILDCITKQEKMYYDKYTSEYNQKD